MDGSSAGRRRWSSTLLHRVGVETGQHDRAVRQSRNASQKYCGRRHRTGRAGRDHRASWCAVKPRGFGLDQLVAPRRRLHRAVSARMSGQRSWRSSESRASAASIGRARPAPARRARPRHLRVAMSSISRARSSASASVEAGLPATSGAAGRRGSSFAHAATSCASSQSAFEAVERGGKIERGAADSPVAGEGEFVLVDIAERHDARQQHGVGLQHVEKHSRASGRRAASADRAWRRPSARDSRARRNPSTSLPSTRASITVRQKRRRGRER